jgi:hypothetical protein
MALRRARASRETLGCIMVCISVGAPGARCRTAKEITVIPRKIGIIRNNLFRI